MMPPHCKTPITIINRSNKHQVHWCRICCCNYALLKMSVDMMDLLSDIPTNAIFTLYEDTVISKDEVCIISISLALPPWSYYAAWTWNRKHKRVSCAWIQNTKKLLRHIMHDYTIVRDAVAKLHNVSQSHLDYLATLIKIVHLCVHATLNQV